ncbi:hypothetical protein [Brevibacterium luteolum]|uniref:hypothetical protein n=1 Tax=Brevibacterium luteolum TaxID=199591 RepID=UPI001C21E6D5|nr:hypothetical protein [Brevibacterium luteolum]MBU8578110.1 hypothetical protein [Brevibacterium luteolum]
MAFVPGVVEAAEQCEVVQIGGSAVAVGVHVVGFAPADGDIAVGEAAAAVACFEQCHLGWGGEPGLGADLDVAGAWSGGRIVELPSRGELQDVFEARVAACGFDLAFAAGELFSCGSDDKSIGTGTGGFAGAAGDED